jgi:hypothetical protein
MSDNFTIEPDEERALNRKKKQNEKEEEEKSNLSSSNFSFSCCPPRGWRNFYAFAFLKKRAERKEANKWNK